MRKSRPEEEYIIKNVRNHFRLEKLKTDTPIKDKKKSF